MTRWRGVDPWGPVLGLLAAIVFLLHGFGGVMSRDVSVYAYAGQQVAEGVPPYVQILNRAGPLAHLVPGAAVAVGRVVGVDDVLAMRGVMAALSVLAVWVAYVLGRDLYASRLAGVVTAATLLSFQGFVTYATDGPREKTTMVLLALLALWAVCRRRWLAAGATTALATLTWQGMFVPLAAIVVLAALVLPDWRARAAALARFAGAGLAVTAVTVLYFLAVGALPEAYEGFYAVSAGYADPQGLLTQLGEGAHRLRIGFGWSRWLLLAGVAASVVGAGLRLRRLDRTSAPDVTVVGVGLGSLVCLLWALKSFEGWPDAFPFLPFAACGLAGLVPALVSRTSHRVAPLLLGALAGSLLVATATTAALDRSTAVHAQRRHVLTALAALDDPQVLAISNPTPLVMARQRNPIRYQIVVGAQRHYLEATYPGGLRGLALEIEQQRPPVITVFGKPQAWLRPVLKRGYVRVGGRPKPYAWFVATSATSAEQRDRMRDALSTTLPPSGASDVRRSVP